ncbi:hypothetical protein GGR50DRAFT_306909 [Xylaria sp. CBS 124048]|nr:hypothetical protein GGR50DRAFT_306909 [Xylaria sp. CBS 124048]
MGSQGRSACLLPCHRLRWRVDESLASDPVQSLASFSFLFFFFFFTWTWTWTFHDHLDGNSRLSFFLSFGVLRCLFHTHTLSLCYSRSDVDPGHLGQFHGTRPKIAGVDRVYPGCGIGPQGNQESFPPLSYLPYLPYCTHGGGGRKEVPV